MASIYTCEQLKRRIENHSHFYSCFKGDVYQNFNSNKDLLRNYKNSYDSMINLKNKIINSNYENKNKTQQLSNMEQTSKLNYENIKSKYQKEEELTKIKNESEIEEIIRQNEIKKNKTQNNIASLDTEIENLKVEIQKLEEQNDIDIDCKKKTILNKIKNDYKLKLVKFQNEKEKEKERTIALYEIKKKNFEIQKELEINKMKNLSLIIQELIAIFKANSLNN